MASEPADQAENNNASEEKGQGSSHGKRATAAALIDAFAQQYQADRKDTGRREKHRIFREWLTIIGLFIAAAVAFFQWRELRSTDHSVAEQAKAASEQLVVMRSQLEEMKSSSSQIDKTIAAFESMAGATNQTAKATRDATENASKASERQLRAYVGVEPRGLKHLSSSSLQVNFQTANAGITPALNMIINGGIKVVKLPLEHIDLNDFDNSKNEITEQQPNAFPNTPFTFRISATEFTEEEMRNMKSSDYGLLVCAFVDYDDIFEKRRSTKLCVLGLGEDVGETYPNAGDKAEVEVPWYHGYNSAD